MFYQIFLSPQVKQCAIPSLFASRVAERLKAPNPRTLGNIRKVSKPHRMTPQRPAPRNESESSVYARKKLLKFTN